MFVFSYFPILIINKRSTKSPTLQFYILVPAQRNRHVAAPKKQNRGHPYGGVGPLERSHRMLLSQAEKKVASMARELDALTAFERQKFFSTRPREGDGWGRRVQVGE